MDEDYYKECVLPIVSGGDGWNELYSSVAEFKQHLNGGAALVEEEVKHGWLLQHHSSNTSQLQSKIIALFKHIASVWSIFGSRYLVQFWEAVEGEGRCHYLSTSNQPFCVSTLRKGDSWYRNLCIDHVYHVEEGAKAEQLGSVGRAYNNKQPESTPDLRLYSTKEFPLRDQAARCGFRAYFTLPLFDFHHQNQCYGVLEVFSHVPTMEGFLLCVLDRGLQPDKYKQQHNGEIRDLLELAIKAVPQLSLAQVWVPCKQCVNIITNICCMETISFIYYKEKILNKCDYIIGREDQILDYLNASEFHNLQIDLSRFRRDLWHVSTPKNPLSHYAERARLPLSFAIYLRSLNNNNINHFYVIEFFLQPKCRQDARDDSSLNLLLRIIHMKLKGFNFVMDRQLQEQFMVQSKQPPNASEFESIDLLKPMDSNEEIFSELNFIKYLGTVDLCSVQPSTEASNEGWVFCQPNVEELYGSEVNSPSLLIPEIPILKEKINYFMKEITTTSRRYYCMVQFWASKMVEDRCCLETWDQPYALSSLAKGLASFRRKCMTHRYFVDVEAKEEELGPPGRVFRNGYPELLFDIFRYSTREFSLRGYAVHCGLIDYFVLPVFDEHQHFNNRDCVGVLEFIGFLHDDLANIGRALKVAKLQTACIGHLFVEAHDHLININNCEIAARTEIEGVLYLFTNIPQCHNANVWVSNGKCINSNSRTMRFTMLSGWWSEVNSEIYVEPKIGILGMILEYESKSCFCRNIFGFSISEQPLAYMTRSGRCNVCFGICLQSSHTGDLLYVLEFFLYQGPATNEYILSFLNFLLPIIKYELKTFKLASGKQLEEELVVEVIEFSQANQLSSSESEQLGVFPIKLKSVLYDQQERQHNREQHVHSNPKVRQADQCNAVAPNFGKTEKGKKENRLHLSLEVLKPHFGKKLVNVVEELGVGRSTIKRVCRNYGMKRWPNNKRQATNPSLFQVKSTQGHRQDMQPSSSSSNNLQGKIAALTTSSVNTIVSPCAILNNNKNLNTLHGQPSPIPIVCYNVGDEVGTRVAYLDDPFVVVQEKGSPKKRVENTVAKERMVRSYALLPTPLKMMCICFKNLNDGRGIPITLDDDVFCNKCEIYVHLEDFMPFCDLEPISGNCIVVYIWHLYNKMKDENTHNRFQFVNPFTISYVPNSQSDKRAHALADRFNYTSPNQLVLVPCNVGEHWILTIIQPYKEVISLLDPLGHCIREPWKDVVNMAISIFNVNLGKKGKEQPTWELIKAPLQPDFKQCGYYVMRYMKEIVQGLKTINSSSLSSLFVREGYSQTEINEVRIEWALRLQEHVPDSLYYKVAP